MHLWACVYSTHVRVGVCVCVYGQVNRKFNCISFQLYTHNRRMYFEVIMVFYQWINAQSAMYENSIANEMETKSTKTETNKKKANSIWTYAKNWLFRLFVMWSDRINIYLFNGIFEFRCQPTGHIGQWMNNQISWMEWLNAKWKYRAKKGQWASERTSECLES